MKNSSSRARPAHGVSGSPQAGTAQVRFCRTPPPRSSVSRTRSSASATIRIAAPSPQSSMSPRELDEARRARRIGFI